MSRPGHISHPARSHAGSISSRSSLRAAQARDSSTPMHSSPLAAGETSPVWSSWDSRHRRASSSASAMTAPDVPFPRLEDPALSVVVPRPSKAIDRTAPRSGSLAGETRAKLRSNARRGSRAAGSLDLSKSVAENEDMGAYTSFERSSRSPSTTNLHGHQRSVSAVSPLSTTWTGPAPFIHPMRQTPGSFTPPYLALGIHTQGANSEDGESEKNFVVAPSPQTFPSTPAYPPSARRRPSITVQTTSSTGSTSSQTNLKLVHSPTDSSRYEEDYSSGQGTPPTARSSFDSMFGRRYTNPEVESKYREAVQQFRHEYDEAEGRATVQQLRREYAEKQRRKDAKLAAKEAKAQAKRERREFRQAARSRKGSVTSFVTASDDDDEEIPSDRREAIFPRFSDPAEPQEPRIPPPEPQQSTLADERTYTPSPLPEQQPPVKRTIKAASNKWGRMKFDATTLWIHSMRSVGLRTRN